MADNVLNRLIRILEVFLLLCSFLWLEEVVMYRGGSRGSSGARYSSYRSYNTYRSYSTYRSTSYRGSSYSSSYRSARFTRTYGASRYYPMVYYHMYFYYSSYPSRVYSSRSRSGGSYSTCKNYEANSNGSYLGSFKCPLDFEPINHNYCCGSSGAEYCCPYWKVPGHIAGVVIGCVVALVLILIIVICTIKACKAKERRISSHPSLPVQNNAITMTQTSGNYVPPTMQFPNEISRQYPPPYAPPSYPGILTAPTAPPPAGFIYPPAYAGPPNDVGVK